MVGGGAGRLGSVAPLERGRGGKGEPTENEDGATSADGAPDSGRAQDACVAS